MTEYAPQYTVKEKLKIIGLHALWVFPVMVFWQFIGLPWMNTTNWFLCNPHGYEILLYGICVGCPLLGILISLNTLLESIQVIKLKQYPLPSQKTFHKTQYVYGFKAKFRSYFFLIGMIAFISIAISGFFVASGLDKDPSILEKNRKAACPTSLSSH